MIGHKIYRNDKDVLVIMWKRCQKSGKVTSFYGKRWSDVYRFDKATAIKKVYAGLIEKGTAANCGEEALVDAMNNIWDLNTIC